MKALMERLVGGKSNLQKKILRIYLLGAILPIIIITVIVSTVYYNNILNYAYDLVEQNDLQHSVIVRERLDNYEDVVYELAATSEYIELAKLINTEGEDERLTSESMMKRMLRSSIYTNNQIRSITFLADSGDYVTDSKSYNGVYDNIWADSRTREEIHDKIGQNQTISYIATVDLKGNSPKPEYVILMGIPVRDLRTKEQSGVFVVALEQEVLMLENREQDWKSTAVTTIIVDENKKILCGCDNIYVNQTLDTLLQKEYNGGKKIAEKWQEIEGTAWQIVSIINLKIYESEIAGMVKFVVLLILVITVVFCLIVIGITRKYIRNIQKIAEGIQSYEGTPGKQIEVDVDEKDELYIIARQFKKMTDRVNSLVEALRQKNEDIREASIRQKHAEIKALEAQINPHFLYNTLDSINWRAIENDEEEISNMLGALGSLLRYSVSNIDMMVVLEAEISWLKKYIFLQRDRFHDSFDCQYDIQEEALSFPIYKMLLQPIIENSILHAFEEVKEGGMIYVSAVLREDQRLEIRIRDNGSGMEPEVLEEIRKEIRDAQALNSKSIGISNVINRLRVYYQEEAELAVNSVLGEGSEFILIIPRKAGKEFL